MKVIIGWILVLCIAIASALRLLDMWVMQDKPPEGWYINLGTTTTTEPETHECWSARNQQKIVELQQDKYELDRREQLANVQDWLYRANEDVYRERR